MKLRHKVIAWSLLIGELSIKLIALLLGLSVPVLAVIALIKYIWVGS